MPQYPPTNSTFSTQYACLQCTLWESILENRNKGACNNLIKVYFDRNLVQYYVKMELWESNTKDEYYMGWVVGFELKTSSNIKKECH